MGIINVSSTKAKTTLWPGKRKKTSAMPPNRERTVFPMVTVVATIRLLRMYTPRSAVSHTSRRLAQSRLPGTRLGDRTAARVWVALISAKTIGKATTMQATISTEWTSTCLRRISGPRTARGARRSGTAPR